MLKALELAGFKSFADRTRFEFPSGVSIVVGPNGSGKSNVVDAVKWVLGSQSAKSLRGNEMTDVIFNGSATRASLGASEVTLTLNNADARLPIDAREVHVTRRVYRSGEGEYLINRQPCRLRDIRELLSGTGITTEAYCIIEQGKVDVLLQASPRDRREIFEEAAGISQFKAKKVAAGRRLERVEQNLLRLSDIVDEVESRLRNVRAQASKARRYRECTTRLQQLRTEIGLVDWRALTRQIAAREDRLAALATSLAQCEGTIAKTEAESRELEQIVERAATRQREIEALASTTREQIASIEATIQTQSGRHADMEQELGRTRRQLAAMKARTGAGEQLRDAAAKLDAVTHELEESERTYNEQFSEFERVQSQAATLHSQHTELLKSHTEATLRGTALASHATSLEQRLATLRRWHTEQQANLADLEQQRDNLQSELIERHRALNAIQSQLEAHQDNVRAAVTRLAALRQELSRVEKQQRHLDARSTRTHERIAVLTELSERLEGLNSGVRDVLMAARSAPDGPLGKVRGVIADLFQVDVDSAPMVDAALGEQAEYLVLESADRLFDWLDDNTLGVGGRVGFLRLDGRIPADTAEVADLSDEPGVIGRADQFIETNADLVPLAQRLLGRTWFVDRLTTALRLARSSGRRLSFVTTDGELLTADGTLVVGPRRASTGLLSRRSELHACHQQLADLERQLQTQHSLQTRLETNVASEEAQLAATRAQLVKLNETFLQQQQQSKFTQDQLDRITQAVDQLSAELEQTAYDIASVETDLQSACNEKSAAEDTARYLEELIRCTAVQLTELDARTSLLQIAALEKRVAAAKCEQRVETLQSQLAQAQRDEHEREQALTESRERVTARETQLLKLDETIAAARASLAELCERRLQLSEELEQHIASMERVRRERGQIQDRIHAQREELGRVQAQHHKLEMATNKLRHERQTLVERMQEDYRINLEAEVERWERSAESEVVAAPYDPSLPVPGSVLSATSRDSAEREIADLRNQISRLGAVNLDSLAELDELEARFGGLAQQYHDLVEAKAALERIIQRINIDSRQLFLTTLETVREHFRELFRRLFGGGEADIVIDESEDVLECGIDIVACPPGKEACNISLLSGGEKTLTCVALLLAVFRSKPSPFCILDEVDAALDESNIGRFIGVLRDFLSFTQFIVVTHSKKTMSGADTLYGVTMEESGVSKHVSVRFEDVTEDGHILPSGLGRNPPIASEGDDLQRAA
jgi:chromosome segregation protein